MNQRIPKVSDSDILRIINREFKDHSAESILDILKTYRSQTNEGKNRIYVDILKLSNGDINLLKENVRVANNDYRDIISLSEYPEYSKHAFTDNLSEEEKAQIINDDWKQYQDWFLKK